MKKRVVIVTTANVHKEILLTIRRKKCDDDDDRELKCRNYIRVGHEIQLNENKDDEVIENDVCLKNTKYEKKHNRVSTYLSLFKTMNVLTCERYY